MALGRNWGASLNTLGKYVSSIVVLCEGETEELAVERFIARQWKADGFGAVSLGHRNFGGNLNKVGPFACNSLDNRDVLAVFTLVDLYGMNLVIDPPDDELDAKVERLKTWLRTKVGRHRRAQDFFPHVSVHEVEAWILAEGGGPFAEVARPKHKARSPRRIEGFPEAS